MDEMDVKVYQLHPLVNVLVGTVLSVNKTEGRQYSGYGIKGGEW